MKMPQYVAYQKNVAYAYTKLSVKSHSFNMLCTMDVLSCLLQGESKSAIVTRAPYCKILNNF